MEKHTFLSVLSKQLTMIAKVFLLCAAVASASAAGFYSSPLLAPALYNSGVYAPGLLNSVVAPGLLSAPLAASLPATYATKTVVAAPAAVSYAAPVATAYTTKSVVAAPAAVSYAAPALSYAAPALSYAAPVATTYTTKSVVAAPAIAAPVAYAAPKTVIGATSLLTGTPLVYSNGLLANRLVSAAAPLAYSGGLYKGSPYLAGPGVVKTILK